LSGLPKYTLKGIALYVKPSLLPKHRLEQEAFDVLEQFMQKARQG
jgi:hypothetical protein